jgi:hypothetical protein
LPVTAWIKYALPTQGYLSLGQSILPQF